MLARACLERLVQGDAIIVSAQEHEANSGVWRKLADYGIDVRIWCVDPNDGRLQLSNLLALLDNRVRLVAVTHCSNLVGEINPVRQIADATHDAGGFYLLTGYPIAHTVSLM